MLLLIQLKPNFPNDFLDPKQHFSKLNYAKNQEFFLY